jgi:valyl-tRNA synthetase
MDKKYDPKKIENKWIKYWEKNNIYKFDPDSKKKIYSIDIPPPTASGDIHIGHIMHYTQFEFIARYKRMAGFNVFFPFGFDDNGLPTEKYVETEMGVSKTSVDKEKFIKLCLDASKKLTAEYTKIFKTLGHSPDWSYVYNTMSDYCQKQAQRSFVELYKKGEIYRAEEPTIWCIQHQTALAQAEIEDCDRHTILNYVIFELEDGKKVKIATTRPELLGSCVGVFVHPNDKKYKKMIGKKIKVPLFDHKVSINSDEKVDMDFGSGMVMVCTFGDTQDIDWWKMHKLPLAISINEDGTMNEKAGKYKGMKIEEARKSIIKDLQEKKLISKQEKIEQTVGTCWRCGKPIEFLVSEQWFIKMLKHKKKLEEFGNKVKWYPSFYKKRYFDWNNNLKWNWCISRQRYFGIPFPVWYCKKCNKIVVADEKDLPVDPNKNKPKKKCSCGSNEFIPEKDVMDTWMTSSMTPMIISKWKDDPKFFKKTFPQSMRASAHDIISYWNYRTILKSYLHENSIPWKDLMVSGHGLDEHGKKMSKSKGNVVHSLDIAKKYSADAVRYWSATAKLGEDLFYREGDIKKSERVLIKLWNASRFVYSYLKDYKPKKVELRIIDKWLLSELSTIIKECTKSLDSYGISKARREVEIFFFNIFCDNYLEIVKHRLNGEDKKSKDAALYTLFLSLKSILKLFAPFIPFITEELYQTIFKGEKSIHISDWPKHILWDVESIALGNKMVYFLSIIRKYKTKEKLPMNAELKKVIIVSKKNLYETLEDLKGTIRAKEIDIMRGEKDNIQVVT